MVEAKTQLLWLEITKNNSVEIEGQSLFGVYYREEQSLFGVYYTEGQSLFGVYYAEGQSLLLISPKRGFVSTH